MKMKWNEMEWNGMDWNEMKWNEMKWNEMKWNEMKWNEKQISSFLSSRWGDLCSEEYFSSFSESTVSNAVVIVGWNTGRKPSTSQVKIKIASRMLWRLACVLASASPTAHRTTRPAHLNLCVGVASQSTITLKWLHLLDVPILWSENVLRDVTAMVVFDRSWRFNMYKRIKLVFFGRHIGTELLVRWLLYGEVFSLLSYFLYCVIWVAVELFKELWLRIVLTKRKWWMYCVTCMQLLLVFVHFNSTDCCYGVYKIMRFRGILCNACEFSASEISAPLEASNVVVLYLKEHLK